MKQQHTVQSLRQSGYKVRVITKRLYRIFNPTSYKFEDRFLSKFEARDLQPIERSHGLQPNHGITTVEIDGPNEFHTRGEAICGKQDVFNRKKGLNISISKAMGQISEK